jgi:hypothetical protein
MPTKLKPIKDVIANPAKEPRSETRETPQEKLRPEPPREPPPREKR